MRGMRVGSEEHKRAFCQSFMETHEPYEPAEIVWPEIDADSRAMLASLPVWDEAVSTERETALKVQSLAKVERDPVMREAIALQGYEEGRHSAMLDLMTKHYGIAVPPQPPLQSPPDPEWAFMRVGYGECFDSFFAFGLFALAGDSGLFPRPLVVHFDPVMQEEARHILFFVNWVAYRQVHAPLPVKPVYLFRRSLAIALQVLSRIRTALDVSGSTSQDNFAMKSHESFGDFSPRQFIEICLRENTRRLAPYDERLLRPRLVPSIASAMLKVLPRSSPSPRPTAPV